MTTIFACICGKYDESQDLENDFKDKHGPLNENVNFFVQLCFDFHFEYLSFYALYFIQRISKPSITFLQVEMRIIDLNWTLTI
jgi:hypothetical protein